MALSCSCSIGETPEKLEKSDYVFTGKVTSVELLEKQPEYGDPRIIVKLDVIKSIKGKQESYTLHTAYNEMGCYGYWFKKDDTYLIYAFKDKRNDGKLNSWWCGGVISKSDSDQRFTKEVDELDELISKKL